MPAKSTPTRYGAVPIAIHWITALALLGLLVSGFRAADMLDDAAKTAILRIHTAVGIAVLALTLARLLWWVAIDRKPAYPAGQPRWQQIASAAVHSLLYLAILLMAGSGIGMMALSGAGDIVWGGAAAPLPDFRQFAPRAAHGIGATLLIALTLAHTAAALYHQFILRDRLLARMGLGRA
jgi:cytochrome b561